VKLTQDLREFVASLTSRRAEFLVVGAHAVAYHGYPRFTGDIDLWVRPTLESSTRGDLRAHDARPGSVARTGDGTPRNCTRSRHSSSSRFRERSWTSVIAGSSSGRIGSGTSDSAMIPATIAAATAWIGSPSA
jgi:hypothetical protein